MQNFNSKSNLLDYFSYIEPNFKNILQEHLASRRTVTEPADFIFNKTGLCHRCSNNYISS